MVTYLKAAGLTVISLLVPFWRFFTQRFTTPITNVRHMYLHHRKLPTLSCLSSSTLISYYCNTCNPSCQSSDVKLPRSDVARHAQSLDDSTSPTLHEGTARGSGNTSGSPNAADPQVQQMLPAGTEHSVSQQASSNRIPPDEPLGTTASEEQPDAATLSGGQADGASIRGTLGAIAAIELPQAIHNDTATAPQSAAPYPTTFAQCQDESQAEADAPHSYSSGSCSSPGEDCPDDVPEQRTPPGEAGLGTIRCPVNTPSGTIPSKYRGSPVNISASSTPLSPYSGSCSQHNDASEASPTQGGNSDAAERDTASSSASDRAAPSLPVHSDFPEIHYDERETQADGRNGFAVASFGDGSRDQLAALGSQARGSWGTSLKLQGMERTTSQTLETVVQRSMSSTTTVHNYGQHCSGARFPMPSGWARTGYSGGAVSPADPDSSPDSASRSRRSGRALGQQDRALALKLDVLSGPSRDRTYVTDASAMEVRVGRSPCNELVVADAEVSSTHAVLRWDPAIGAWLAADAGSLNATALNGQRISAGGRQLGQEHRLSSDDILQLGSATCIKVTYLPREMLEEDLELHSITTLHGLNAPPPPIHRTASRDGLHRAPSAIPSGPLPPVQSGRAINAPHLYLRGYVVSRVGREHQRRGQACEDVAHWRSPLLAFAPPSSEQYPNIPQHASRDSAQPSQHSSSRSVAAMEHSTGGAGLVLQGTELQGGTADWGAALAEALAEIETLRLAEAEVQQGCERRLNLRSSTMVTPSGSVVRVAAGLFCVFDGHCGREAAEQAQSLVPDSVASRLHAHQQRLQQGFGLPEQAWLEAFAAVDADLQCDDGCTATALMAWRDDAGAVCLQAANVGDSAAAWTHLPPGLDVPGATPLGSSPMYTGQQSFVNPFAMGRPEFSPPRRLADQPGGSRVHSPVRAHLPAPPEGHNWQPGVGEKSESQHEVDEVHRLTADHRLTAPGERQRLAALGIQLSDGRTRLYGLNLARCLGDKFLKDEDMGLSSEPYVSPVVRLEPGSTSALVIIASDGLWDVADEKAAMRVAIQSLHNGLRAAAEAVLALAQKHRTRDDVTIMLLHIQVPVLMPGAVL